MNPIITTTPNGMVTTISYRHGEQLCPVAKDCPRCERIRDDAQRGDRCPEED